MRCRYSLMLAFIMAVPTAAQAQITPGQWETTVTIKSLDMPGAPPQVQQMMKSRMASSGSNKTSYCITPEQAAKGPQDLMKQNPSCKFTKFQMKGGVIATEMTCTQNGGTMTARSNGNYTANSFSATATAVMTGQMSMKVTSSTVGRRIGPCK